MPSADDSTLPPDVLSRASWARVRWPGGAILDTNLPARIDEPVHAGSIFKLVVARAALAQGLVTARTRFVCPRRVEVQGRRADCVHPDLGRPLALDDALAYSCNHFFVRLAERLDRAGLTETLRRLSSGAVLITGEPAMPWMALGVEGPRAGMRTWARIALAAMAVDPDEPEGSAMIRRGAARAASEGTAVALADDTSYTLAKTGTTMGDSGVQEGRVVAWRPESAEAIVVRAPGVAGRDAARIARAVWDAATVSDEPRVRVGRTRDASDTDPAGRVDDLPLEAYVAGVVAAEGEQDMPSVALQALAVAARSYAIAPARRHTRDGYDVCDTTHCQVLGAATRWSREAAAQTRGVVLALGDTVVRVPYSASCSGVLSSPRELWGGDDATLTRTGPDPVGHTVDNWQGTAAADALYAALKEAGYRGDVLRGLRVVARTREGLPSRIALDGLAPAEIDASTFRHIVGRRLGWDVLKSHAWDVTRVGVGYRFTGRGKGHGAGLCLRGASVYAARGSSLTQVMSTYVPGASLISTRDQVVVRVPSQLMASAQRLRKETRALLAGTRVRLRVFTPRLVTIEVHPTVASYQRATGRAWWTSASTRAVAPDHRRTQADASVPRFRIDVAPRSNGALTAEALTGVLRHELVHVLTGPLLVDAPAWVAEGLATEGGRLDTSTREPSHVAGPCPSDALVVQPGSLETMRDAYARAGACLNAALPGGLASWRTLVAP
ncbi:SpoIID/LytB domain-containing protein [Luteitalea pratensis]|uniref:SpoIID/LytB domain-containing protein n=1 Tax=Luteitalea pratensis TaxID=1855912 RepID=UPI0013904B6E|nr:SpoIID/LytB domain-containing protein [Luteitalea pratensis]